MRTKIVLLRTFFMVDEYFFTVISHVQLGGTGSVGLLDRSDRGLMGYLC